MPYYNRGSKRDHNFDNHPYREPVHGIYENTIVREEPYSKAQRSKGKLQTCSYPRHCERICTCAHTHIREYDISILQISKHIDIQLWAGRHLNCNLSPDGPLMLAGEGKGEGEGGRGRGRGRHFLMLQ